MAKDKKTAKPKARAKSTKSKYAKDYAIIAYSTIEGYIRAGGSSRDVCRIEMVF